MRAPATERTRWHRAWVEEGRAAIRSTDTETWDEATAADLELIGPELALRVLDAVVDVGCGPGRVALALAAEYRVTVHGIDIAESVVSAARREKNERRVTTAFFHLGDGRTIPVPTEADAAYSMLCFQHLEAEAVAGYVAEIGRILRAGGRFRFQWTVGESHERYAQDHAIGDMIRWCALAGMEVVKVEPDERYSTWRWATAVRA